ncbi:MAG: cytochrome C [Verrucomicrobia bacterium]|nr:cytochrome C [Verrucomicrobiota bacterium]
MDTAKSHSYKSLFERFMSMASEDNSGAFWKNRITTTGVILSGLVGVAGVVLLIVEAIQPREGLTLGVIVYLVWPGVLAGCVALAGLGLLWGWWRLRRQGIKPRLPAIDLHDHHVFRRLVILAIGLVFSTFFATIFSYRMYHFTESSEFCGLACHKVMRAEYVAYKNSPHSNVGCAQCHIGPGAEWYVKAKLSGLHQVYVVAFDTYKPPIKAPVEELRPARETCNACHRPDKFFGAVLRTWTSYMSDKKNSPWTIKMLMHIGGGNPNHGAVRGIHWHMEGVNTIEYVASDPKRLDIPWVRVTDQNGKVNIYQAKDPAKRLTSEKLAGATKRTMDCMDCHNRPTHWYLTPDKAMDLALQAGRLDDTLPDIKATGVKLLSATYTTTPEALLAVADGLKKKYAGDPRLDSTVTEVQHILKNNIFPEQKARWDEYPDHIGHRTTPGCFRCHDGKHVDDSGKSISKDCRTCHTILAQGPGKDVKGMSSEGLEFQHPEDIGDSWKEELCNSCHGESSK